MHARTNVRTHEGTPHTSLVNIIHSWLDFIFRCVEPGRAGPLIVTAPWMQIAEERTTNESLLTTVAYQVCSRLLYPTL